MIVTDLSLLRSSCIDVASLEEERELVSKLEQALTEENKLGVHGIGLAAPQIGIAKRAAIIRIGSISINLINSRILERHGSIVSKEGCLSIPGKTIDVERAEDILLQNNSFEKMLSFGIYGLPAICVQHEMDHWDGVLMIDKDVTKTVIIGPNMPCPCGSKMKFKKCCGKKQ